MVILKKLVHALSSIAYVFITVYALISLPIIFKYKPLVVLSGSMEPSITTGSIIYYKSIVNNELNKGDIITFKSSDGSFITHRIVNIEGDLIETRGDANNTNDPKKVKFDDVVGKVGNIYIPFLGYLVGFINNNMVFTIIVIVTVLILEFIFSNMNSNKDRKSNEE